MTKSAIKERFWYLRHMYTCQLRVHRNGGTCFDPLLMHYPHDDNVFATNQTEHTFLVGDAIKVTPVTESGA
jgi:alpha-glucosidase (family GH31 glycosyl hydrolase)